MEKLKNTKMLGVIGNIAIIISLFLPWVYVEATSIGLSDSSQFIVGKDGKWALILSIFSLIVIFAENIAPKFLKGLSNVKITIIPCFVQLLMIVNVLYNASTISNSYITYHFGIGFYLMCVGVVLCMVFPFIYKQDKQNKQNKQDKPNEQQ